MALVPAVCYWHWRAASPFCVFARGAETQGEALESKAPRSWWQSSQQGIHTANPSAPPLFQKSHLLAFGKHVIVCLFSKRWERRGLYNCGQNHGEKLLGFCFLLSPTLFGDFWHTSSKNNVDANKTNFLEMESSTTAACDTLVPVHITTNGSEVSGKDRFCLVFSTF